MRTLTFEILDTECVGDSLGKHNYNSLSLDTAICNLSSNIFNINNNILSIFNDISSKSSVFNDIANQFSTQECIKYNQVITTVGLLSSYWSIPEITVHYESNIYQIDGYNNTEDYGTLNKTLNAYVSSNITDSQSWLKQNSLTYITNTFPASNYNINTILNLNVYNYDLVIPNNVSALVHFNNNTTFSVSSSIDFSSYYKVINDYNPALQGYNTLLKYTNTAKDNYNQGVKSIWVEFFKDTIYIKNIYTLKYKNINNSWKLLK